MACLMHEISLAGTPVRPPTAQARRLCPAVPKPRQDLAVSEPCACLGQVRRKAGLI